VFKQGTAIWHTANNFNNFHRVGKTGLMSM